MHLKEVSINCVDNICETLMDLIRCISLQEEFAQYPLLASHITTTILDDIINVQKQKTKQLIIDTIKYEEDYIWTDSKGFSNALTDITQKNKFDAEGIRHLLESYFTSIKKIIGHSVPKIIMSLVVREIEKSLLSYLIHNIVTDDKIQLLREDEGIEKQRIYYNEIKNKIYSIKQSMPKTMGSK